MALRDLIYRCPRCGRDPVEGTKDEVRCPGCGCRYERGEPPAGIRVREEGEKPRSVPAHRLMESIREAGGPFPAATSEDGSVRYEATVEVRQGREEEALRYRGSLLGFAERLEGGRREALRVTDEALELVGREGGPHSHWNLMDLRAVQSSSSSLQVYTATRELVHFRFLDDSPYRWEELLHELLRRAYRESGRGEIVEFQPRIAVR